MTIHLPEDLERFIQSQVRSGQFASEDEAIAEAVRRLKRWEQGQAGAVSDATTHEPVPAWERVLDNMKDVPDAAFDQVPADSSGQLDHSMMNSGATRDPAVPAGRPWVARGETPGSRSADGDS